MTRKARLFLASLVLLAAPGCRQALVTQPTPADALTRPGAGRGSMTSTLDDDEGPFYPDWGDGWGSGGGSSSTTCARRCSDGSWSSIACLARETAHCTCSGSPLLANPYCS
jgi:hypothetical protein